MRPLVLVASVAFVACATTMSELPPPSNRESTTCKVLPRSEPEHGENICNSYDACVRYRLVQGESLENAQGICMTPQCDEGE